MILMFNGQLSANDAAADVYDELFGGALEDPGPAAALLANLAAAPTRVWPEASRYNPRTQQVQGQHVVLTESGARFYPTDMRIAPLGELDLMARVAGLQLEQRRGGWGAEPFTGAHARGGIVDVYGAARHERLRRVKRRLDPHSVFRLNQNIEP